MIFAVLGICVEVIWTSLYSFVQTRNPRLIGNTTLWMFPIYGCILFIVMLVHWLYFDYPWWFRGIMYAVLILVWEYISGMFVKLLVGISPWDYSKETDDGAGSPKRFQLHGLICLEYVPLWFIGGLVAEWFYLSYLV